MKGLKDIGFCTCPLAISLVFPHLAVFLAIAEPLQRDAQVVMTPKLVLCTALLAAFL